MLAGACLTSVPIGCNDERQRLSDSSAADLPGAQHDSYGDPRLSFSDLGQVWVFQRIGELVARLPHDEAAGHGGQPALGVG
jgi:hypothetical protein